jgi:sulfite exporter TauE/SafE/copper chaperone CopZ
MAADPATTTRILTISGMTCSHCEVVVERVLRNQPGVRKARVSCPDGRAILETGPVFDLDALNGALREEGYSAAPGAQPRAAGIVRRSGEAAAAIVIVLALFLLARHFHLLPQGIGVSENMTLGLVFVIGLVASISSCMAVTGGLLLALAAKYNEAMAAQAPMQRFVPHVYFNAGRLVSYIVFGALIGLVGSALMLSPLVTATLTIVASLLMLGIGLQMLGLLPPLTHLLRLPKSTLHRIHDLVASQSRVSAFALGAATFFLPCGFTLALQLYVLGQGNALTGALTMLVFALGTLPALASLSALSTLVRGRMQALFLKVAGAAVIVLGLLNIQYGLVQAGSGYAPLNSPAIAQDSSQPAQVRQVQVVDMTISGLEYRPNRFTVKAGIPVEWRINAREAEGCGRILVARGIGLTKFLAADRTEAIIFTPQRTGEIAFNCSMGMMTPNSGFTVVN